VKKLLKFSGLLLVALLSIGLISAVILSRFIRGIDQLFACKPEVQRLNDACSKLAATPSTRVTCVFAPHDTGWGCVARSEIQLCWSPDPSTGWQSDPCASGRLDYTTTMMAGELTCAGPASTLILYSTNVPKGEEANAKAAFGRACEIFKVQSAIVAK
jgi:hypothetical protein